jgi:hypothetical protein
MIPWIGCIVLAFTLWYHAGCVLSSVTQGAKAIGTELTRILSTPHTNEQK